MSSSISSSKRSAGAHAGRAFLAVFPAAAGLLAIMVLGLLIVADPYDTARLTPFVRAGAPATGPRMANASRARDPRFDAAIIGNSTLQLLHPQRLKLATGRDFVQLTIPGTGPREQTALAEHLFRRRGEGIGVLVVGVDRTWCDASLEDKTVHPFPFWLYGASNLDYAAGLFSMDSFPFLFRRMALLAGRGRTGSVDGFWDYEAISGYERGQQRELRVEPVPRAAPDGRVAAARALIRLLEAAPASTRVVLVHPPVFSPTPLQATEAGRGDLARCKDSLAQAAKRRGGVEILDLWVDDDASRTSSMFYDSIHYDGAMAKRIEAEIASKIASPP